MEECAFDITSWDTPPQKKRLKLAHKIIPLSFAERLVYPLALRLVRSILLRLRCP